MRSRALVAIGIPERAVAEAVRDGVLVRLRRVWLALPDADAHLVAAARQGVVVSCVTQAARLGLWVLSETEPHVGAAPHAGRVTIPDAHVHRAAPMVPRHPDALVDPIENVLVLVAMCRPFEEALAVWESALHQGLVDRLALERLPLPAKARAILDSASPFADSGLESFAVPRLRWLRLPLRRQIWIQGHLVDLLIGERLVLQIDGGHHVGRQREEDIRHDAALMLLGYHVIRVGYAQMVDDWASVQDTIMRAVAQGLHRPSHHAT